MPSPVACDRRGLPPRLDHTEPCTRQDMLFAPDKPSELAVLTARFSVLGSVTARERVGPCVLAPRGCSEQININIYRNPKEDRTTVDARLTMHGAQRERQEAMETAPDAPSMHTPRIDKRPNRQVRETAAPALPACLRLLPTQRSPATMQRHGQPARAAPLFWPAFRGPFFSVQ